FVHVGDGQCNLVERDFFARKRTWLANYDRFTKTTQGRGQGYEHIAIGFVAALLDDPNHEILGQESANRNRFAHGISHGKELGGRRIAQDDVVEHKPVILVVQKPARLHLDFEDLLIGLISADDAALVQALQVTDFLIKSAQGDVRRQVV